MWRNEPSHSQVNSHCGSWSLKWILEFLERDYKGQNPSTWRVFYIIEKLLKLRCLKWVRISHLDVWNTSYDHKKGRESNWQLDSWPLKVKNWPDFLTCRWCATYYWKALDKGYNFAWDLIAIQGLHTKLWATKVARVSILGMSRLSFGSPGTKCHLDVAPVERHREYYKGGRWWLPPSLGPGESYESEFAHGSS
jgi:hypothetical protein